MRSIWLVFAALTFGAGSVMGYGTTFVSMHGTDTASCGVNFAPCFSMQAAYNNTDPGGLIKVIDANAYAPAGLVISKPVTIDGSGLAVLENIFNTAMPVIKILASCTIRGVVVQATSGDGIQIAASGLQVHLENVTIQGIPGAFRNGVTLSAPGSSLTADRVTITGATNGFKIEAPSIFSGDHLHILDYSGIGIEALGASATLRDSIIRGTGASLTGIYVTGAGTSTGTFMAERSEISFNRTGLQSDGADGPATLRFSDSVIANNGTGLLANSGGQIVSFRTNMFAGNTSDGVAPLGVSLK